MRGEIIEPVSIIQTREELDINVTNLTNGIYILELISKNEVSRVKVVIEKRD